MVDHHSRHSRHPHRKGLPDPYGIKTTEDQIKLWKSISLGTKVVFLVIPIGACLWLWFLWWLLP